MCEVLYQKGCPCDSAVYDEAAKYGNKSIIKYLTDNGCPQK